MSVGEFTSSNIAASMDHDSKDDAKPKQPAEASKLQEEINRQKEAAKQVLCV